MDNKKIYDLLKEYSAKNYLPMHMPGHKRKPLAGDFPFAYDITEIEGFDNLHNPQGILKEAQTHAAKVCHAMETFFLINGSTAGILTAICAAAHKGEDILIASNCHMAVYHGAELMQLNKIYVNPVCVNQISEDIKPEDVAAILDTHREILVTVITSPTYEGCVSDVAGIGKVVHERGGILIVDEAHGAHFNAGNGFPKSAVMCGADMVIQSTHKTLGALTQTALLHKCSQRVDTKKIMHYLDIFQTSSPSYVLMASLDLAMYYIEDNKAAFRDYHVRLANLRQYLKDNLMNLKLYEPSQSYGYDEGKLVITCPGNQNHGGRLLYDRLLSTYHIQAEMAGSSYIILMTSVMDEDDDYKRVKDALVSLDKEDLFHTHTGEIFDLSRYEGKICADYVFVYPPGIPVISPNEVITHKAVQQIEQALKEGLAVNGLTEEKEIPIK